MRRRDFLRAVSVSSGAVVLAPALWRPVGATTQQGSAVGPYGSIDGREPDENGLLPEGFTSRVIARSDEEVEGTGYSWPVFPDGAATFPLAAGGWHLAVNSENPLEGDGGGQRRSRFDAGGVVEARSVLDGTTHELLRRGRRPGEPGCPARRSRTARCGSATPSGARDPRRGAPGTRHLRP